MNWIALSAETPGVICDENGVPVEWTLLRIGSNPICQEGRDGTLVLSAEAIRQIMEYHTKKGELIPIDSEHYLYELANQKKLDEGETLKLFPGGVAAMGFGTLAKLGREYIKKHGYDKVSPKDPDAAQICRDKMAKGPEKEGKGTTAKMIPNPRKIRRTFSIAFSPSLQ